MDTNHKIHNSECYDTIANAGCNSNVYFSCLLPSSCEHERRVADTPEINDC